VRIFEVVFCLFRIFSSCKSCADVTPTLNDFPTTISCCSRTDTNYAVRVLTINSKEIQYEIYISGWNLFDKCSQFDSGFDHAQCQQSFFCKFSMKILRSKSESQIRLNKIEILLEMNSSDSKRQIFILFAHWLNSFISNKISTLFNHRQLLSSVF